MGSKRGSLPPKEGDLTCMFSVITEKFVRPNSKECIKCIETNLTFRQSK